QLPPAHRPSLQGYLPILSLCQQVVLGLAPMNVDTGAGFVTPQNYEIVAELAKPALHCPPKRPAGPKPSRQDRWRECRQATMNARIAMAERIIELRDISKS